MAVKIVLSLVCITCMILSIKERALPYLTSILAISLLLGWFTKYSMILHIVLLAILLFVLLLDRDTRTIPKIALALVFIYSVLVTLFQFEGWPEVNLFVVIALLPILSYLIYINRIWKTAYRYCGLMLWVMIIHRFASWFIQF